MKAKQLLEALLHHVKPPQGCPIVLRERAPNADDDLNWVASAGNMAPSETARFMEKTAELRNAHPKIDWSGVNSNAGELRRIANYYSEITE
jgi:acyl transferase domain-containing protein